MVERAPGHRVTFMPMAARSLLSNMAPLVNTDVTNPREIYSLLSESNNKGALLTSVKSGANLPPLQLEAHFKAQNEQIKGRHRSYPDLLSFRSYPGSLSDRTAVWRSSSLQDVSTLEPAETHKKKLKPILKNATEHQDKGNVKFGQKEVRLIKDPCLPPIQAQSKSNLGNSGTGTQRDDDLKLSLGLTGQNQKRTGPECSPDIFPRGQPVQVKKPATPKYDDYPEIYWELRSTTVQDPSDLKEDMIDRNRYRLQQISSLRLRAINREVAAKRLDSYRKWQQQIQEHSAVQIASLKQDSARSSATTTSHVSAVSARAGQQLRMSMPIRNHTLAVAAKSIGPVANPPSKKIAEVVRNSQSGNTVDLNGLITDSELRRRQKIESAAKGDSNHQEGKPVKAAVVNLCMEPDWSSSASTSEVYTGIRRVMVGARPLSSRYKTYVSSVAGQDQRQATAPYSMSHVSVNATLGSAQSQFRVPSAPTFDTSLAIAGAISGDITDRDAESSPTSKMLLRKFNRLQVFSEKYPDSENTLVEPRDEDGSSGSKSPYMPQSRPPTYKLDTRHYSRHDTTVRLETGEEMGVIQESDGGGLALLGGRQGGIALIGQSEKPETTALTFRFSNGEVIVSRQGKKPTAT